MQIKLSQFLGFEQIVMTNCLFILCSILTAKEVHIPVVSIC